MTGRGWRLHWIAVGSLCILALVLTITVRFILRRTAWISLPESGGISGVSISSPVGEGGAPDPVEVTPRTVQAAVATLTRPEGYSRAVHVTQFYDGGSGTWDAAVSVSEGWTRVDLNGAGGGSRRVLTDGSTSFIWYGGGTEVYQAAAAGISADDEQLIPTYEDVLSLNWEDIVLADLRLLSGERCVYIEADEEEGRRLRYWISVESGLLASAEILEKDVPIYRMEAEAPQAADDAAFLLPDGTDVRNLNGEADRTDVRNLNGEADGTDVRSPDREPDREPDRTAEPGTVGGGLSGSTGTAVTDGIP